MRISEKFIIFAPELGNVSDVHKLYRFISVMIYNNNCPRREKIC